MVPRVGFEPTTYRLRSGCSTAELPGRRSAGNQGACRDKVLTSNLRAAKPICRIPPLTGFAGLVLVTSVTRSARRMLGRHLPALGLVRFCNHDRQGASSGGPGRCPPHQNVETAAIRTEGPPLEALSTTDRADIARIRHRGDGAVEPLTRPSATSFLSLLGRAIIRHRRGVGPVKVPSSADREAGE